MAEETKESEEEVEPEEEESEVGPEGRPDI